MARSGGMVHASVAITMPENSTILGPIKERLRAGLESLALETEAEAKSSTSFHDQTGALRKRIKARKIDDLKWVVEARSPYAHLVEYGAAAHAIYAGKTRTIMRFWVDAGRSGGSYEAFATKVSHPGVRARPFLRPAAEKVLNNAVARIRAELGL